MKKITNKVIPGSRNRQTVLDCYYEENGNRKPVVIFCHGFKGYKDWGCFNLMAERFAQAGFVFVKFNFSYNGGTLEYPIDFPDLEAFSENNFSTELNDLGIVIDLLFTNNLLPETEWNPDRVSLMGHSRGGGIVVLKTAEDNRIHNTITLASVSDFGYFFHLDPQLFKQYKNEGLIYIENSRTHQQMPLKYQLYEDFLAHKDRLDILKRAKEIGQEVLIFHGTKDSSVNIESANALHENIPNSRLEIIEDADHVFGAYQPYTENKLPNEFDFVVRESIEFLEKEQRY